jgi:hypothetical protein
MSGKTPEVVSPKPPVFVSMIMWALFCIMYGGIGLVTLWGWNEVLLQHKLSAQGIETTASVDWFDAGRGTGGHVGMSYPEIGYRYKVGSTTYENSCDISGRFKWIPTTLGSQVKIVYLRDKPAFSRPDGVTPPLLRPRYLLGLCIATFLTGVTTFLIVQSIWRSCRSEHDQNQDR